MKGCLKFFVILFAVIAGLAFIGGLASNKPSSNASSGAANQPASPPAASAPSEVALSTDQLSDAKVLDDRYGTEATSSCDVNADDYLRSIAKYDFKWDDDGFLSFKFDQYLAKVSTPGVITLVSHKAMLQNGFGAFQRTTVLCIYDTQARKNLGYRVLENE